MDRYFIDRRSGCIAVIDRKYADPYYMGLNSDIPGVVRFWEGKKILTTCHTCGHTRSNGWEITEDDIKAANTLCKELNDSIDKEEKL